MSGRTRMTLADGRSVTGYRKTLRRRSPPRPLKDHLQRVALAGPGNDPGARVRMAFALPRMIEPLVSKGPLTGGVDVLGRGFVRISSWSADKCFDRAQSFFRDIAKDRPGFTVHAIIVSTEHPNERYSRHLTVVRGAVVISSGFLEPKIYEGVA